MNPERVRKGIIAIGSEVIASYSVTITVRPFPPPAATDSIDEKFLRIQRRANRSARKSFPFPCCRQMYQLLSDLQYYPYPSPHKALCGSEIILILCSNYVRFYELFNNICGRISVIKGFYKRPAIGICSLTSDSSHK